MISIEATHTTKHIQIILEDINDFFNVDFYCEGRDFSELFTKKLTEIKKSFDLLIEYNQAAANEKSMHILRHNAKLIHNHFVQMEGFEERISNFKTPLIECYDVYAEMLVNLLNSFYNDISRSNPYFELADGNFVFTDEIKAWIENSSEEPPQQQNLKQQKDQEIQTGLNEYGFSEFLKSKGYNPEDVLYLISVNRLPYIIALLSELGYLDYFQNTYYQKVGERNKKIAEILNESTESVKKYILSLTSKSTGLLTKYNAAAYISQVQNTLKIKRGKVPKNP